MALALISARGVKHAATMIVLAAAMFTYACQSPIDLDVVRTKVFTDSAVHPTRLSLYYYYGDSAYEAIVSDTAFLNTIWIERASTPFLVTIPRLQFTLPDTVVGSASNTPFVRSFCFSSEKKPCDGYFTMCKTGNSWLAGEYLTALGSWLPFDWQADYRGRQIRLAYYDVEGERLIKGAIQILVADPSNPTYASYRVAITMEF